MATLGRRSHDTRPPTRPPSPLPPPSNTPADVFSDDTPRPPARIPSDEGSALAAPAPQKRLAMFTEKLSSGTSSLARGPAQLLPGSRSNAHSRADSQLRENASSPAPAIAPSTSGGAFHTSPSKVAFPFCSPSPHCDTGGMNATIADILNPDGFLAPGARFLFQLLILLPPPRSLLGAHLRLKVSLARNAPPREPRLPPQLCAKPQFRRIIRHSRFRQLDLPAQPHCGSLG